MSAGPRHVTVRVSEPNADASACVERDDGFCACVRMTLANRRFTSPTCSGLVYYGPLMVPSALSRQSPASR